MNNPKPISKNVGDKLIELDKHINKSHEFHKENNEENGFHSSDIPEINLEDLNMFKNNSIISNESLDKVYFFHFFFKKKIILNFLRISMNKYSILFKKKLKF